MPMIFRITSLVSLQMELRQHKTRVHDNLVHSM